jgi:hypothetical protein
MLFWFNDNPQTLHFLPVIYSLLKLILKPFHGSKYMAINLKNSSLRTIVIVIETLHCLFYLFISRSCMFAAEHLGCECLILIKSTHIVQMGGASIVTPVCMGIVILMLHFILYQELLGSNGCW